MSRWFRMYDDLLDDPKVQRLPPDLFKAWVNLLCLASRNDGKLPCMEDIAFALRIDEAVADQIIGNLSDRGLLDETDESVTPHNWNNRQFKSDKDETAAERQRAKRERDKAKPDENVTRDKPVTSRPPETEADTETEKKNTAQAPDRFDDFYEVFPRKQGKGDARKAFKAALLKTSAETLVAAARAYAGKCVGTEDKFIKTPAAWLNAERWQDADLAKHQVSADPASMGVPVFDDTPQMRDWIRHLGKRPFMFEIKLPGQQPRRGRYFPSEYPPQQKEQAA